MTISSQTNRAENHQRVIDGMTRLNRRGPIERILDWFYGYDYFICYRWSDGRLYALALAQRLKKEGFDCFLDSASYVKGDNWKRVGERSLKRTSRLVLVGSPEAVRPTPPRDPDDDPVVRELGIFRAAGKRVIAINFDGVLSPLKPDESAIADHLDPDGIWIDESFARLAIGPSEDTISELRSSFDLERQSVKRARVLRRLIAVFAAMTLVSACLTILVILAYRISESRRIQAEQNARIAEAGRLSAESARLSDKPQLSTLLASEAIMATVRAGDPPDRRAEQGLRDALNRIGGQGLGRLDKPIEAMAFTRGGKSFCALSYDGGLRLRKSPNGRTWPAPAWTSKGIEEIKRMEVGDNSICAVSQKHLFHWNERGTRTINSLPPMSGYKEDDANGIDYEIDKQRAWRSSPTLGRLEGYNLQGPFAAPSVKLTFDGAGFNRSIFDPTRKWFFVESFRGKEYLANLSVENPAQSLLNLSGFSSSPIEIVKFDSGGQTLAIGCRDGGVYLWKLSEKRTTPSMTARLGGIPKAMSFAEKSPWLVVVQDESESKKPQKIVLLDCSKSPPIAHELPSVPFDLRGGGEELKFSGDDRWFAVSDGLRATALIDLRKGLVNVGLHVLHRHRNSEEIGGVVPAPVKFSPDSRWLATVSDDNRAHLWFLHAEFPDANHLVLNGHDAPVTVIAFDDGGRWMLTGGSDQTIRAWDLQTLNTSACPFNLRNPSRQVIVERPYPRGGVDLARFSFGGDRLLVVGHEKRELWRIREPGTIELERQFAASMPYMSETGRWLFWRQNGVDDVLIDLASEAELPQHSLDFRSTCWGFSPGDEYLIGGDDSGNVQVWKLDDAAHLVQKIHLAEKKIDGVAVTPDGRHLLAVAGAVTIWQERDTSGAVVASETIQLGNADDVFGAVQIGDDGQACLIAFKEILERSNGVWNSTILETGPGHSVALEKGLCLRTTDSFTEIIDLNAKANGIRHDLSSAVGYVTAGRFAAKSGLLALGNKAGEVLVFNKEGDVLRLKTRLPVRELDVKAIAISPSGLIATGESDGTVRLWRQSSKDDQYEPLTLGLHRGAVKCLDFSCDDRFLVSGGEDDETFVFPMSLEFLQKSAESAVGRGFTPVERSSFFPQ
jgi:WD40 repeat protein